MALPKIYDTPDEAIADVPDGATIMVGGFVGIGGNPRYLTAALARQGAKGLTLISNFPGVGERLGPYLRLAGLDYPAPYEDNAMLLENGQVKKCIAAGTVSVSPTIVSIAEILWLEGKIEIEVVPQGTLVERIRAGGAGIKGFYTAISAGTYIGEGKETRIIDGEECVLEYPLRADYAFIKAYKADKRGNLTYRGTSRDFNPIMATAADVTIVEVDEVVELGELGPETIITPGIYVDRIVKVPKGYWTYQNLWVKEARR